jgi:hypothetical protein
MIATLRKLRVLLFSAVKNNHRREQENAKVSQGGNPLTKP